VVYDVAEIWLCGFFLSWDRVVAGLLECFFLWFWMGWDNSCGLIATNV
jgi:hypothetical protein